VDNNSDLIIRNVAEVITKNDLDILLSERKDLKGYIGVEPSGLFHLGWMIWAAKLKDLMDAGLQMIFFEATWHAWINDKLDGNMDNIEACASYLELCLDALSVDINKLKFVKANELVDESDYWAVVLKVAKHMTLARAKRALTIMGRKEGEAAMDFSKLIYPAMQVSDIFYLDLDLCLGGMDQRKAHILAREVAEKLGFKKPICVHMPLLIGLKGLVKMDVSRTSDADLIDGKMSKSKPETCIFIHDPEEVVYKKMLNAYCPPRQIENNPVIDFNRYLLFSEKDFKLNIERPKRYGGSIILENFLEFKKAYQDGQIHPLDLKNATAKALNNKLEPIRKYFKYNKKGRELYLTMKKIV
jgi:tyrosyl-tRNA synthetase